MGALASGLGRRSSSHYSPTDSPNSPSLLVRRQFAFPILAVLAVAALGLWLLLPGGALRAQDAAIEYPENGTDPVATYTAVDPEQTAIVSWTLAGTDAGVFDIAGGVLTFKKAPDYEKPGDVIRLATDTDTSTAAAMDNMYEVTVQATDSTNKVGMKNVVVEVTNVDEAGKVTLSALQPQSAVVFTATESDPDGNISDLKWQWAKASSKNGAYADIDKEIADAYTPVDGDIGSYLRATASYTDKEGSGKSAMGVSEYAVTAVRGSNNAPAFPVLADDPDTDDIDESMRTRKVPENTKAGQAIGNPVVAEDKDGDVLTYTLIAVGDNEDVFSIDWATGQLMTKGPLDAEGTPATYTVTVRATDPAGIPQAGTFVDTNSAETTVTITVTDVNEPPAVTGDAAVPFAENGTITNPLHTYVEDNPEDDETSVWSKTGADAGKFDISTNGDLMFKAQPDYEAPGDANGDNVYEVTVVATDDDGNRGAKAVKVTVTNEDEAGVVTLSRTQPRVGVSVTASLTDPDGSISGLRWQWSRGTANNTDECDENGNNDCLIKDATSDAYTPVTADIGVTLMARASYNDGQGVMMKSMVGGATANPVAVDTRNKPPAFGDQDKKTSGTQNETATREVEENTKALAGATGAGDADDDALDAADGTGDNVGGALTATDLDPNTEPLIYTLSGDDAGSFRVRQDNVATTTANEGGQIEVAAGAKLDYEMKDTYMVTLTAEDSFGASASIMVTIMVTDMDEAPEVAGDATAEYAENGAGSVANYTAEDPEGAAITSWTLSGDDAGLFSIEGGVLKFKKSPNFEAMGTDNMHSVTVQATDETNKVGMKDVVVEVTNVNEAGKVTLSALQPQSAVAFTAVHTDPDGSISDLKWQWAKAGSKNGAYADIDKATGDAYTPVDGDVGSYLRATASYTDNEGSGKSAMVVSEYAVQALRGANKAPAFPDQNPEIDDVQNTETTREVTENTKAGQAIGNPVVAEDEDSDVLTYTLDDAGAMTFDIDWATGQLMTKAALDAEGTATYEVTVRATDPAGMPQIGTADTTNSASIMVTITVTNVNEPPAVTGEAAVMFQEVTDDIATELDTYGALDPDPDDNNATTWSVTGDDAGKFNIPGGVLTFKARPDYEAPGDANTDNVYEVTVVAADNMDLGNRGTMDVKVTVINENEPGVVTLSRTQPRVGVEVTASLTDPDGSISGLRWQWYNGAVDEGDLTTNAIADATSDTYTPVAADATNNGVTLMARASYNDGQGIIMKMAVGAAAAPVVEDTRNKPPAFGDQDKKTSGTQNETATREVEENTKALAGAANTDTADDDADNATDNTADNVGGALTATEPDPNEDPLIYTLSGADAGSFRVRDNGQIEVAAGAKLDYETKDTYMVTLTAEDSFGLTANIDVTITVTDLDEGPEISEGGLAISGPASASYAENGTGAVDTYMVSGPDADMAMWTLEGDDAGQFSIPNGMLMFMTAPDYEMPMDMGGDNMYMVTVKATDGTNMDTHDVTVMVTNVEEMGTVTLSAMQPRVGTPIMATLTDDDGMLSSITWQWASSSDMSAWTDIVDATSASYMPVGEDENMYLRATAMYTDGEGSGKSEMAESANMVIANTAPEFAAAMDERSVEENTAAGMYIGAAVAATDAEDDTLIYTLGGDDMASFDIDPGHRPTDDNGSLGLRNESQLHGRGHGHGRYGRKRHRHGDHHGD